MRTWAVARNLDHGIGAARALAARSPRYSEIYFSIFQRKVLWPNDLSRLKPLVERLLDFQYYWEATAKSLEWKFTRPNRANV